ncbi:MAG: type II secretion system F family protein [Planctomycetales bacterium]|nr:type II secretion system F family protein [Planctomycetales bacterium]
MQTFSYIARRAASGERVEGQLSADTERAALEALDRMELLPVEVAPAAGGAVGAGGRRRVSRGELTLVFRQLADLLRVGVPITRALQTLGGEGKRGEVGRLLDEIRADVTGGKPLSEAMARHPRAFDPLAIGIVRAGEAGGFLDEALSRISTFRERDEALRSRIRAALTYPAFLCVLGVGVVTYLMVFFIPRFTQIFKDMGKGLPGPTKVLIGVSDALATHGLLILAGLVVGGFLAGRALRTDAGRAWRDRTLLRVPGLGPMLRKTALSRFCRVLGTLLKSGVPILDALAIARDAVGNAVVAGAVEKATEGVREGRPLAGPLAASPVFPRTLVDMVEVGEEAGNLEIVLVDAAEVYDGEVDRAVKVFLSLLEPVLLVLMGALVGFIVIAMLLPIFTLNAAIK